MTLSIDGKNISFYILIYYRSKVTRYSSVGITYLGLNEREFIKINQNVNVDKDIFIYYMITSPVVSV